MKSNLMSNLSGIEESRPGGALLGVCRVPQGFALLALGYRISPRSGLHYSIAETTLAWVRGCVGIDARPLIPNLPTTEGMENIEQRTFGKFLRLPGRRLRLVE